MLTAVAPGTVYDPDTDNVTRAEVVAEVAADAERKAVVREAQRIAARANEPLVVGSRSPSRVDQAARATEDSSCRSTRVCRSSRASRSSRSVVVNLHWNGCAVAL